MFLYCLYFSWKLFKQSKSKQIKQFRKKQLDFFSVAEQIQLAIWMKYSIDRM